MTRLLVVGCSGRMGKTIEAMANGSGSYRVIAGIDQNENLNGSYPIYSDFDKLDSHVKDIDVVIDFSNPSLLNQLISFVTKNNLPTVIATTGLSGDNIEEIEKTAKKIPVFRSANMSLGINVMIELCKKASLALGSSYDVEITEKHHNKKVDAPSGTALMLADGINNVNNDKYDYICDRTVMRKVRDKNEIGIQAVRGGNIVGEHEVMFIGEEEMLSICHSANSRGVFAEGALKAAGFIKNKEAGLYNMTQLVSEIL